MTPARIWSDPAAVPDGAPHFVLFDPFWGPGTAPNPAHPMSGRYERYVARGRDLFALTDVADAEAAVLPAAWEEYELRPKSRALAEEFARVAARANKPLVVFYWSDSTDPVPLEGAYVFRTSLYRSQRRPRERAMPAFSVDIVERYLGGELPLREWREQSVVGFCGTAGVDPGLLGRARTLYRRARGARPKPLTIRGRACLAVRRSKGISANFIFRPQFWAGAIGKDGSMDFRVAQRAREEFVRNMVDSDYVLCVRGGGNFTYRLYETLSCGRIPLFIDTDCVLPLEEEIDWRSLCVWVDQSELESAASRVAEFHEALGPDAFREHQLRCRETWLASLSAEGFFSRLSPRLHQIPSCE
jgi:hypothetical protein